MTSALDKKETRDPRPAEANDLKNIVESLTKAYRAHCEDNAAYYRVRYADTFVAKQLMELDALRTQSQVALRKQIATYSDDVLATIVPLVKDVNSKDGQISLVMWIFHHASDDNLQATYKVCIPLLGIRPGSLLLDVMVNQKPWQLALVLEAHKGKFTAADIQEAIETPRSGELEEAVETPINGDILNMLKQVVTT